jgi:monoterpene epsilon-lactone hydrolase
MASIQSNILAFLLKRQEFFGGETIDPVSLRLRIERLAGKARPPRRVRVVPVAADSVPGEWLVPPDAPPDQVLLYIHGGAWFMGSTTTHRSLVAGLAHASGARALSIDYRLAPEHPFPAGLDDCIVAYEWLLRSGIAKDKIVVAGDSAGGNLTLALLIALRDAGKPLPAGAVAISPATDLTFTGESYTARAHLDPFFSRLGPDATVMLVGYTAGHDPRDPLISPLYADLHGLPPLLLHVGDHEALLDGVVGFGERASAAGVDVQTVVWPGMFHVFQIFAAILPEARQANAQIAAFIRSRLDDSSQGPVLISPVGDEPVQGGKGIIQHGG